MSAIFVLCGRFDPHGKPSLYNDAICYQADCSWQRPSMGWSPWNLTPACPDSNRSAPTRAIFARKKRASSSRTPLACYGPSASELEEYFTGKRREFTFPLDLRGTDFQRACWRALLAIPYGETRTYADIARAVGKPNAFRAVGMANNRNPVAIVVPCHRVIASDGTLCGYGGGLEVKRKLLELEGALSGTLAA